MQWDSILVFSNSTESMTLYLTMNSICNIARDLSHFHLLLYKSNLGAWYILPTKRFKYDTDNLSSFKMKMKESKKLCTQRRIYTSVLSKSHYNVYCCVNNGNIKFILRRGSIRAVYSETIIWSREGKWSWTSLLVK